MPKFKEKSAMAVLFRRTLVVMSNSGDAIFKQVRHNARYGPRRPHRVILPEEYARLETKIKGEGASPQEHKQDEHKLIELDASSVIPPAKRIFDNSKFRRFPKFTKKAATDDDREDMKMVNDSIRDDAHQVAKKKSSNHKSISKFKKAPSKQTYDMLETVIGADGELIYTKLPNNDPIIGSLKDKSKKSLIFLEGKRLIKDALLAKCHLKSIIFSRKSDVEELKPYLPKIGAKLYKAPYREISMWSDLTTSPGLMGFFKKPQIDKYVPLSEALPITIVCDNIKEPGNLGAILRTAAGVGVERVILSKGCVDLWDTKVLRSACGGHFRVQILNNMEWSDIKSYISDDKSSVFIAPKPTLYEEGRADEIDTESKLAVVPYHEFHYDSVDSLVLIIGGETEGISHNSYKLAKEFGGCCLSIPLNNEIESLTAGTALGLITFEMKRQIEKTLLKREDMREVINAG